MYHEEKTDKQASEINNGFQKITCGSGCLETWQSLIGCSSKTWLAYVNVFLFIQKRGTFRRGNVTLFFTGSLAKGKIIMSLHQWNPKTKWFSFVTMLLHGNYVPPLSVDTGGRETWKKWPSSKTAYMSLEIVGKTLLWCGGRGEFIWYPPFSLPGSSFVRVNQQSNDFCTILKTYSARH